MARYVIPMEETRSAYRVLVGKPKGNGPLGRCRRRWEDNVKFDVKQTRWKSVEYINVAWDKEKWRVPVYTVMNLRVP
jgi:hypothetical protein